MDSETNQTNNSLTEKLWVYTNYDCNLWCTYCTAASSPKVPRRALGLENACKVIDEAVDLEFEQVYFTGGEPFILDEIYDMLAYSSERINTIVLTNAMLFNGKRLETIQQIKNDRLVIQVSLDGAKPEQHDPYRGDGTFDRTVQGIHILQENGFKLRLSTTETPANSQFLDDICSFRERLGIPEENHFIRPLAKRGFSDEGMEVDKRSLVPELTVNVEGVYWHPLSTDPDMMVSEQIFPLSNAVDLARKELESFEVIETAAEEFK
jgi:MoaA/NifB/PqqE/SkfB family radical SAM enzyme